MVLRIVTAEALSLILLLMLSACSNQPLNSAASSSSTDHIAINPKQQIIPAQNPPSSSTKTKDDDKTSSDKMSSDELDSISKEFEADYSKDTKPLKNTSILTLLIGKVEKAISLQQWLRAQRNLEQALRLAPQNATLFLLYGNVYTGLGVPEQAQQMFRRALFLADKEGDTASLVKEKLDKLTSKTN